MASNGVHPPSTPPANKMSDDSPSKHPRPHFYIVRPDKTFVPLIPADELPSMICIKGVPTNLTLNMITEWNMARVGDQTDRSDMYYGIEFRTSTGAQQNGNYAESTPSLESSTSIGREGTCIPETDVGEAKAEYPKSEVTGGPLWRGGPAFKEQTQDAINSVLSSNKWEKNNHPSRTKDAATPGIYGRKMYCTYWIRTGSCDYQQEGCKYLHVIPDAVTRMQIGVRDLPRWHREDLPLAPGANRVQEQSLTTNQGWRREVSQKSQAEPSDASRFPSRRSVPQAARHTSRSTTQGMQKGPFAPPSEYLPTHANHMANQHPHSYLMNPLLPSGDFNSATATAAASYKQQKAPPTPAPSPPSRPEPTTLQGNRLRSKQPSMSRSINAGNTAPDQLTAQSQARETSNRSAPAPSEKANHSILANANEAVLGNTQVGNDSTPAPSPANYANFNKHPHVNDSVIDSTQSHNGQEVSASSNHQDTPAGSSASSSEEQYRAQYLAWRAGLNVNGQHQLSSIEGHQASNTPINPAIHANNQQQYSRSSNPLAQPAYNNPAAYPPGTFQNSSPRHHTPPMSPRPVHRRLFRDPGQAEYVANPVEVEKVRTKHPKHPKQHQKNGGGQRGGPVGRGKNHFDLIALDG